MDISFPPMRDQFRQFEPVSIPSEWFRAFSLPDNIIAICEPYHLIQEVISFLILGSERALLLDTGMGVDNIRRVVESLTLLPVIVVNSHTHFDHVGGNRLFDFVYMLDVPDAVEKLKKGYALREDDENLLPSAFLVQTPEWNPFFGGSPVIPVQTGYTFDLGGRHLTVDASPGHSPDSLVLVDHENNLLFCGDTVYPGPLYAHLDGSDPLIYRKTMRRLYEEYGEYTLICSHNEPIRPGSMLKAIADAFDIICKDKPDVPFAFEGELIRFDFDGFSILKTK